MTTSPVDSIADAVTDTPGHAQRARSALVWNAGYNLFRDLLQFGVMLVLTRLLTPAAYGTFALVISIVSFVAIVSYNNFLAYIVQAADDADVHYQDHFTAGAAIAAVLFVAANAAALVMRTSSDLNQIAPLLHLMSLTFLTAFPGDFRIRQLEREQNWKRLRLLHAGGIALGAVLSIWMAWWGAGVYALFISNLVMNIPATFDLFVGARWVPLWTWSWTNYREAWHFGVNRIGSGMTGSGRQLAESSVLAATLGLAGLGVFNRAIGLSQMFCRRFAFQFMYAIYPVLTRLEGRDVDVARVNGLLIRTIAWVVIPMVAIFTALSSSVILNVYGQKWREVIPLLPLAMLYGGVAGLAETANTLVLSRQKAWWCLAMDVGVLCGTCGLLFWVLPFGASKYLAGLVVLHGLAFAVAGWGLFSLGALRAKDVVRAIVPPTIASGLGYAVCELWRISVDLHVERFWVAVMYGALFFAVYLLTLRVAFPMSWADIARFLPHRRRALTASLATTQS